MFVIFIIIGAKKRGVFFFFLARYKTILIRALDFYIIH